jgi:Tfp pilus assembly ATPase PilU
VAAVEVMVNNARIAELIQENRVDGIPAAIEDGAFFKMQTFSQALIDLVLTNQVEGEVAADAATNRHDFLVALDRAEKHRAAEERAAADEAGEATQEGLRLVQPGRP